MRHDLRPGSKVKLLLTACSILALPGCGVMSGGTTKIVSVASSPSAATITSSPSSGTFTTPASLELERKNSYTLIANKDGYSEATFQLQRRMRTGPLILDILFTGLIGVIVDAATGGWYDLKPETVTISMEQLDPSMPGPDVIEVRIGEADLAEGDLHVDSDQPVNITVIQN